MKTSVKMQGKTEADNASRKPQTNIEIFRDMIKRGEIDAAVPGITKQYNKEYHNFM